MTSQSEKTIAVIVGRAGSKGLPGKNSLPLGGRPMILHSIDHALNSRHVDRVIVSTDGDEIAEAARSVGVEVVIRPPLLASDQASIDAAVRHAIESIGAPHEQVVILYANVPIRPHDLIDRAVEHLMDTEADSVQSYEPVGKRHPWWMISLNESSQVTPWKRNNVYRRQDLPPAYFPDGGVIAVRREALFTVDPESPHAFLGRDRQGIVNNIGDVVDVDDEIDLIVAEAKLQSALGSRAGA